MTFNDSGAGGTVSIPGAVTPRLVTVDVSTKAYALESGTVGGIGGSGRLVKTGAGTLTLSGSNSFSGGATLQGGTILLADAAANQAGLGTGTIRFEGGTLTMAGHTGSQLAQFPALSNPLHVPAASTGTINLTQRGIEAEEGVYPVLSGPLTGAGTLRLNIRYVRGDIYGDWSAFTGLIEAAVAGSSGDFRFGRDYSYPGFPNAEVRLASPMSGFFVGNLAPGAGTTVEIGGLSGVAGSAWRGGPVLGRSLTYRIGGRGGSEIFAGSLGEQSYGSVINNVAVVSGGTGYTSAPAVTLSGGSGSGATATATVSGGIVTSVRIVNRGNFYTAPPAVTFSGGGGSGAAASASIGMTITSFVKTGAGTWTLSGSSDYFGGTTVEQGTLRVSGTLKSGGANFEVQSGAALELMDGTIATSDLRVAAGGRLSGQGTITGEFTNAGTVICGPGALNITGDVVNEGTMRFTGGAALNATGRFVNNGILDLLTGGQKLPADFENHGIVIDSSSLGKTQISRNAATVAVTAMTYRGHSYQLQRAGSLTTTVWENIGSAHLGNDAPHTFTDPGATGPQRYYRVAITP